MTSPVGPEFLALQQALIGHYSLERELGRGGMGVVFLAKDVALDRPVAIKLLPPALAADGAFRERFLREARTAAKLSQPNIVPIHAVEEVGDLVHFVMAYIEGETLGERVRSRGPLTPREAARLLQEVAWALGYAHGRGVVHRDVKPDNIMIERGTGRAVVMDFGIARATETSGSTAIGEVLGTAQYMSPEQANGDPVDGRADLYSLGVVGFLALAGRLPFEAEDTAGMLAMHITKPAPPLASLAPGVPSRLARAVDRCLQKAPADRFPTGEALAEAIAQTVEAKRELPVPVRIWVTPGGAAGAGYVAWYGFLGFSVSWGVGALAAQTLPVVVALVVGITAYALTPLLVHFGYRVWRLRRLLASGYGLADVRLAVRDVAERRREEVSYQFGAEPPRWAKVVHHLKVAGTTVFLGAFAGLPLGIWRGEEGAITMLVSGGIALAAAVVTHFKPGRRRTRDPGVEWRLKFWFSRFGEWLGRFAGLGVRRNAAAAELTYRPTELAIGLAAGSLFESLPRDQKKELRELPALIERLERDAALMRRTVDDLGGAIASLGEDSGAARSHALQGATAGDTAAALADTRSRLRDDLVQKRDEAAQRLAAAVAALESIRLNLLRLKAGMGTVGELTADLSAARDVSERLSLEAAARKEVEALVRGVRQSLPAQPRPSGARHG